MKIWAHRGCSQRYPENTLVAFEKAADLRGLAGIELDIQLTKDGELVVFHDERVDRTTDGIGEVSSFSLKELRQLKIEAGGGRFERIPTMKEVFDLLEDKWKREKLRLNIELKNSVCPYIGMEEKILDLVYDRGAKDYVIYSSFYARSLEKIKMLDASAQLGILDVKASDCLYKLKGGCGANVLHPFWKGMDLTAKQLEGYTVRAWLTGHLYPEQPTGTKLNLEQLEQQGITDVFLNEPEQYITGGSY